MTLTDEGILNDVLLHPLFVRRRAVAAAKLDPEDAEALERSHQLLRRVTRGRRGSDLFRFVSAVDFTRARDLSSFREAATPDVIARFGEDKGLRGSDLVVDCEGLLRILLSEAAAGLRRVFSLCAAACLASGQHLHYGMGEHSPFKFVRLFGNSDPSCSFLASEEMLSAYPKEYSHRQLRLYCRDNAKAEAAAAAFKAWATHHSVDVKVREGKKERERLCRRRRLTFAWLLEQSPLSPCAKLRLSACASVVCSVRESRQSPGLSARRRRSASLGEGGLRSKTLLQAHPAAQPLNSSRLQAPSFRDFSWSLPCAEPPRKVDGRTKTASMLLLANRRQMTRTTTSSLSPEKAHPRRRLKGKERISFVSPDTPRCKPRRRTFLRICRFSFDRGAEERKPNKRPSRLTKNGAVQVEP